jgi:hypothetical protein
VRGPDGHAVLAGCMMLESAELDSKSRASRHARGREVSIMSPQTSSSQRPTQLLLAIFGRRSLGSAAATLRYSASTSPTRTGLSA